MEPLELGFEAGQRSILKRLGGFSCWQAWCIGWGRGPRKSQQDSGHVNRAPTIWPHTSPETEGALGYLQWVAAGETKPEVTK